jgi:hypothetical protein
MFVNLWWREKKRRFNLRKKAKKLDTIDINESKRKGFSFERRAFNLSFKYIG